MKFAIGPCTCGHTTVIEATNKEDALEMALDNVAEHLAEYHQEDPELMSLSAMSREEMRDKLRPTVHSETVKTSKREPAFRETLVDDLKE